MRSTRGVSEFRSSSVVAVCQHRDNDLVIVFKSQLENLIATSTRLETRNGAWASNTRPLAATG
jgi:hypothetical protein